VSWKESREWNTYDEILEASANAWIRFVNDVASIRSIGTREWATVDVQGGRHKTG
jgi:hypothetical protein